VTVNMLGRVRNPRDRMQDHTSGYSQRAAFFKDDRIHAMGDYLDGKAGALAELRLYGAGMGALIGRNLHNLKLRPFVPKTGDWLEGWNV